MIEYNFYVAAINRGDRNPHKYFERGVHSWPSFYSFNGLMKELMQ
tara:strand:- start:3720 stop:3854 length:135 start_codon:yes stop_codon:yes gene_type:complete